MTERIHPSVIHAAILLALAGCAQPQKTSPSFVSAWPADIERTWVGPEYWANRLQDWRIANGRLECLEARPTKPMRTVHLLTRRLADRPGRLNMTVKLGLIDENKHLAPDAAAGFLIGAGAKLDYRAAALIHHSPNTGAGLFAGVKTDGALFIADFSKKKRPIGQILVHSEKTAKLPQQFRLSLLALPRDGSYSLRLALFDPKSQKRLAAVSLDNIDPARLVGNIALVSHPGSKQPTARFWFKNFTVSGSKLESHPERNAGPILSAMYTLSRKTLKLTAQMMPLGKNDNHSVTLSFEQHGHPNAVATDIITPGYIATFKILDWDDTKDTAYTIGYDLKPPNDSLKRYTYSGTVKHNPKDKNIITVAAFTGNHNVKHPGVERGIPWTPAAIWFPHNDIVDHVAKQKPDLLFFSGDQVYEGDSPTSPEPFPEETGQLDYLYKWYLWCWAFRDLARDIPTVTIPDDHDVFQGNLFGCSGRLAPNSWHDGGYIWPAENVNMLQRTQTSHLPDPYDPTPVERGIEVYYTAMNYGRISFAIIEDRKFKGDFNLVPGAVIKDAHIVTPYYDADSADVPGVPLLGQRQLDFLDDWTADWSNHAVFKVLLSQTIFCNLQTRDSYHDKLDLDLDSDGWPQSARNRALRILRKANVFHIAGDQHLASIVHHGADDWDDSIWSFCVPSIANFYPRSWLPPHPCGNHQPGMPPYTGQYKDGFGNHITVWAAANPNGPTGKEPRALHDNMPGYGIVKLNKSDRTITMQCWPRYADPTDPNTGSQYPGWPKTIKLGENR